MLLNSPYNIGVLKSVFNRDYEAFEQAIKEQFKGKAGFKRLCSLLQLHGENEKKEWKRILWHCYLDEYVQLFPDRFKLMESISLGMTTLSSILFVTDKAHCGGEYPGKIPRSLRVYERKRKIGNENRWTYLFGRLHFR